MPPSIFWLRCGCRRRSLLHELPSLLQSLFRITCGARWRSRRTYGLTSTYCLVGRAAAAFEKQEIPPSDGNDKLLVSWFLKTVS
jgi:hypothetical protein